jgi:hypothetical protein
MSNSATRPCKGCGGSGHTFYAPDLTLVRTSRKDHWCAGQHDGDRRRPCGLGRILKGSSYVEYVGDARPFSSGARYHWYCAVSQELVDLCLACLGSGSVTDGPFRRDAEVDAETPSRAVPFWREDRLVRAEHPLHADLWIAAWQGERAGTLPAPLETADQAAACGRIAAQAAFRAVPALRGK